MHLSCYLDGAVVRKLGTKDLRNMRNKWESNMYVLSEGHFIIHT